MLGFPLLLFSCWKPVLQVGSYSRLLVTVKETESIQYDR